MAKERPEKAEETEQMIEKEAIKEAAEEAGVAGDGRDMRAVLLSGFGGLNKLRVARKVMPEPQEGELKIRVKAWSGTPSIYSTLRVEPQVPAYSGMLVLVVLPHMTMIFWVGCWNL